MSLSNSHFPIPNIWIVKAKIIAFNRLSPKDVGSFMRVSTVLEKIKCQTNLNQTVFRVADTLAVFPYPV